MLHSPLLSGVILSSPSHVHRLTNHQHIHKARTRSCSTPTHSHTSKLHENLLEDLLGSAMDIDSEAQALLRQYESLPKSTRQAMYVSTHPRHCFALSFISETKE